MSDDFDSSSDDEDTYINAAAKYKALKEKPISYDTYNSEDETPSYFDISYCDMENEKEKGKKEEEKNEIITETEIVEEDDEREFSSPPQKIKRVTRKTQNENRKKKNQKNGEIISLVNDENEPISIMEMSDLSDYVLIGSPSEDNVDSEDYIVEVKVVWRSKDVVRLDIRRHESFKKVFDHFAVLENVPLEQILIMKKEKPISHMDTPISIDLTVLDILEGGIINAEIAKNEKQSKQSNTEDKNVCKIKVQTSNSKQSIFVNLKKDENFNAVVLACAKKFNISESSIKLYFDGDPIESNDTPESLDLEHDACIDLHIAKT